MWTAVERFYPHSEIIVEDCAYRLEPVFLFLYHLPNTSKIVGTRNCEKEP